MTDRPALLPEPAPGPVAFSNEPVRWNARPPKLGEWLMTPLASRPYAADPVLLGRLLASV